MSAHCAVCRFIRRVQLDKTGCWLWTGSRYTQFGRPTYGQFMLNGQRMGAHRAAYLMFKGAFTSGLEMMHSCDVKQCVNPDHLSEGTHSQNLRDGFAAHPGVCAGENHGRARLTWPIVDAIRSAAASGTKHADLATQYGVSQPHISMIVRGLRWNEQVRSQAVA